MANHPRGRDRLFDDEPGAFVRTAPPSITPASVVLPLPVEIIARSAYSTRIPRTDSDTLTAVMSTRKRRPLSVEEVAAIGRMTIDDAAALLHAHEKAGGLTYDIVTKKWLVPA